MKKFNGTAGPWEAVRISRGDDLKVIVKGTLVKRNGMRIYTPITDEIENKHNAYLVAAAPELLEALRQLRDYVEDVHHEPYADSDKDHPMVIANEAISKALGE
jgi:hypothetical protein